MGEVITVHRRSCPKYVSFMGVDLPGLLPRTCLNNKSLHVRYEAFCRIALGRRCILFTLP